MLRTRLLTAWVLLLVLGLLLFRAPATLWQGAVLAATLVASWEWAGLARFPGLSRLFYVLLTAALAGALSWAGDPVLLLKGLYGASLLFWILLAPLWLVRQWRVDSPALLALTGWVVILPTGFALVSLRLAGPWTLLMFMAVLWLSDSAAYFVGRAWGRHKLAPAISPGKTWEGVVGALGAVLLYALALDASGYAIHTLAMGWMPLLLVMTVLGIEGDLFESWIKRCAGVKDSGVILPGHGGILDRIDALTATLPLVALLMLERV